MKKWMIISLILFSAVIFAQEKTSPTTDPLSEKVEKLKNRLELDDAQSAKLREILERDRTQAEKDHASLKTNALDLVRAAYARREQTNAQIDTLLDPTQKEEFKESQKMTPFDHDLFELTEGLMLNDAQVFSVEGILIEFYNKIKEMMPDMTTGMDMPAQGRPPMRMSGHGGGPGGGPGSGMMKSAERKKNRQIKKELTDEQKALFKQILEDRAKKRKEMMKEMKERRKERSREF